MKKTSLKSHNKLIKPLRLEQGDTIALISPSGPANRKKVHSSKFPDHFEKGLEYLTQMGFKYIIGKHAMKRRGYLAGSDKERLEDLHWAFANKKAKAIICISGGYGTPRLLPYIDYDLIRKNPKIFNGYSDITGLHSAFMTQTGMVTFHGPMGNYEFAKHDTFGKDNLWKAITQAKPLGEIPHPKKGPKLVTLHPGKASGRLIGGNLSLLVATLGTPYEIDTKGKLLFLEDVDEEPYRFDRMLNQLLLAGKLHHAKGFILGETIRCVPNKPDKPSLTFMEVLNDLLLPLKKPTFYGLCCGHGDYKVTLPIGVKASMDASKCKLYIDESAVL